MRMKFLVIILVLLTILMASCNLKNKISSIPTEESITPEATNQIQTEFPYFSKEMVSEDYDYMFDALEKNYPHFGTAKKLYNVDKEQIKLKYKDEIENYSDIILIDDAEKIFSKCIGEFYGTGHLVIVNNEYFKSLYYAMNELKATSVEAKQSFDLISNENTLRAYEYFDNKSTDEVQKNKEEIADTLVTDENLTLKILDDNTAYIGIKSFYQQYVDTDEEKILDFYLQIQECKNLIIDVTKNNGGSDYYWMNNLVSPNISEVATVHSYSLTKSTGIYSQLAFDSLYNKNSKAYTTISHLPNMTNEVLDEFDIGFESIMTIPANGTTKNFNGKIYVLVGENVYSAAEGFAKFCKDSGFATLVGTNTAGDGGGLAIKEFVIPNTGLLMRFSTLYPLNADGSSNTEFGTKPDFVSSENESALETCLKIIDE